MSLTVNTNVLSLAAQNNLNQSQKSLNSAIERLSSGSKINSAKDDAAGQAIANRLTSQIKGLNQASSNANDGISLAQTTEGALDQVNDNLQRVRQLTVQAANGTNSASDLKSIQDEIGQRLDEIDRVSAQTSFNGTKVLDGSKSSISVQVGSQDGETISITLAKTDSQSLGLGTFDIKNTVTTSNLGADIANGDTASTTDFTVSADTNAGAGAVTTDGNLYKSGSTYYVKDQDSNSFYVADTSDPTAIAFDSSTGAASPSDTPAQVASAPVAIAASALTTGQSLNEINDSDGNGTGKYVLKEGSGDSATYHAATVNNDGTVTEGDALTSDPLAALDSAIKNVDGLRSGLGAVQNRLDSAITNISSTNVNLSSARSRIEDADYATEVSNLSKAQILQQAGTSVLAQANQTSQGVLSLLR